MNRPTSTAVAAGLILLLVGSGVATSQTGTEKVDIESVTAEMDTVSSYHVTGHISGTWADTGVVFEPDLTVDQTSGEALGTLNLSGVKDLNAEIYITPNRTYTKQATDDVWTYEEHDGEPILSGYGARLNELLSLESTIVERTGIPESNATKIVIEPDTEALADKLSSDTEATLTQARYTLYIANDTHRITQLDVMIDGFIQDKAFSIEAGFSYEYDTEPIQPPKGIDDAIESSLTANVKQMAKDLSDGIVGLFFPLFGGLIGLLILTSLLERRVNERDND